MAKFVSTITKPKMVIIGAGGIGSWFCPRLAKKLEGDQLAGLSLGDITVFDPDIVERKNMKHQAFFEGEEGLPKAAIMNHRFGFKMSVSRFDTGNLTAFNWFVICADNTAVRKIVYEHVEASKTYSDPDNIRVAKKFIDMRAEGRMLSVFTYRCELQQLMSSLGQEPESKQGYSCQLPQDVAVGRVNEAYDVVGGIGMQLLLDDFRGEEIPDTIMHDVVMPAAIRR